MEDLELVVLFADADAQRFVTKLIERGIERRCLRPMKWRQIRDPMHDPRVARDPTAALTLFLRHPTCRFVVVLDHHGSGGESRSRESLESDVADVLARAGVAKERTAVIAFEPELESALVPVWDSVLEILARKRSLRDQFAVRVVAVEAAGEQLRACEAGVCAAAPAVEARHGGVAARVVEHAAGLSGVARLGVLALGVQRAPVEVSRGAESLRVVGRAPHARRLSPGTLGAGPRAQPSGCVGRRALSEHG